MSLIIDKALILKSRSLRENDRIFLIFTEKEGKLEVLGRGTRKKESKLAGLLEPFSFSEITYVRGRGFENVTAVKTLEKYDRIIEKEAAFYWFNFLLEIIEAHIKPRQKEDRIFGLLLNLMEFLNAEGSKEKSVTLVQAAVFKLISCLGFQPELFKCQVCGEEIKPGKNYFSCQYGGLLGSECFEKDKKSIAIANEEIKLIRFFEKNNLRQVRKIKMAEKYRKKISEIIFKYASEVMDREFRSASFIKKMKAF